MNVKFKENDLVECVHSASSGYKTGKQYTIIKDKRGVLCIKGDDGFTDPISMLVSSFKKADEKVADKLVRVWKGAPKTSKQMQPGYTNVDQT